MRERRPAARGSEPERYGLVVDSGAFGAGGWRGCVGESLEMGGGGGEGGGGEAALLRYYTIRMDMILMISEGDLRSEY